MRMRSQNGQILAEIIIAIAVIGVIGAVIATVFLTSLRSSESGQKRGQATALALESLQALRAITSTDYDPEVLPTCTPGTTDCVDSGWLHLFCPRTAAGAVSCPGGIKNSSTKYKTVLTADNCTGTGSGSWDLCPDASGESITLGNETFTRWAFLQNVCRDANGVLVGISDSDGSAETCTPTSNKIDRGTLKATIKVTTTGMRDITMETYVSRWRPTNAAAQALWSGAQSAGSVTSFVDTYDTCVGIKRNTPTGSLSLNTTTACVNP